MRLIDAEKLVDMLYDNEFAVLCPLDEVSGVVDACPTVDAVPAVRCRGCKHCKEATDHEGRGFFCAIWGRGWHRVQPDDFCSYGERKDGDGDE